MLSNLSCKVLNFIGVPFELSKQFQQYLKHLLTSLYLFKFSFLAYLLSYNCLWTTLCTVYTSVYIYPPSQFEIKASTSCVLFYRLGANAFETFCCNKRFLSLCQTDFYVKKVTLRIKSPFSDFALEKINS